MKNTKKIFIIAFLLCIFIYCCKIDSIPNNIILYKGESLNLGEFFGISLKIGTKDCNTVLTSSTIDEKENNNSKIAVKLFETFTVKEVNLSIIEETTVIPIGQVSGLKLYTNGALVVGMSEIKGENNEKYKPYENSDIEEGDRIIKINEEYVKDADNLIELINKSNGETVKLQYVRNTDIYKCEMKPIKASDGTYKLGLWVRDSAAGIGTLTFYEPSTGNFAALGHGITDVDTGDLVEIANGEFLTTKILSISKGMKGNPRKNTRNN